MSKIFGIGLPNTATTSLAHALRKLGYICLHNSPQWRTKIYHGTVKQPYRAPEGMEEWDAITNFGEWFFPQLDYEYPNSKFILTLRPIEDWLKSIEKLLTRFQLRLMEHNRAQRAAIEIFGTGGYHEHRLRYVYEHHKKSVIDYFEDTSQLLIFSEPFGWEDLCSFLDKPIPDIPYPWKHRQKSVEQLLKESEERTGWVPKSCTPQKKRSVKYREVSPQGGD